MGDMDYGAMGLKIGLEIHQQLSTGKLFCSCPCELSEIVKRSFDRVLRPSQSEMGEIDRAALEEAEKRLRFTYESTPSNCLVEVDEEPPHAVNEEAVRTTLIFSGMIGARPIDEIQFMRKIVIDGSNTGGFQRTALVAIGGSLEFDGKAIPVETICLEEDAARRISEDGRRVVFRLDRLGIPLIEVATAPNIRTPEEARGVAERIGMLLRATRRVRRGIGSIREDLNISIEGGARVEIKGVQELDLLPAYIENEVRRQLMLLDIRKRLEERGIKELNATVTDLSKLLSKTKSSVIERSLKANGVVMAATLTGFGDLLGQDEDGVKRLGPELAAHAKVAGVGGIFHSDELPAYGITKQEVKRIASQLGIGEKDSFVLVAGPAEKASAALDRVMERAKAAIEGVPEETRDPLPDGTTAYSRPLPGRERMYPETDIPPFAVTKSLLAEIDQQLPEFPEKIIERLQSDHSLSAEQARTLVRGGFDADFEEMIAAGISPKIVARTLIHTMSEIEGDGLDISSLNLPLMIDVLTRVESGEFSKEAVPMLLGRIIRQNESVDAAIQNLGLSGVDRSEVEKVIDGILAEKRALVLERGERSIAPLMGLVMKQLRGKADGKLISSMLSEKVNAILKK